MNTRTLVGGLAMVLLVVALLGAATNVGAADVPDASVTDQRMVGSGNGPGGGEGLQPRHRGGQDQPGPGQGRRGDHSLVAVAAEVLGMERRSLAAELAAGATIGQVADANGVERQAIIDAFVALKAQMLQDLVDAGALTQEEADERLAHVVKNVAEQLDRTTDDRRGARLGAGGCRP